MQVDDTNSDFIKAVNIVNHTNRHLFLTGRAGTGKTTFLKYLREHSFKKMVVVAPTGVAAINAGGVTIHSFFQLPFGTYIANKESGWLENNNKFYNSHQLLGKLRIHKKKRDLIRELDLLVIDEVSMVRADVLDAIDTVLRHIRRRHHEPFGGLQMVYIGDLFQLPPVVPDQEWELLKSVYEGPFFFHAKVIREANPIYLELKKIYRQDDPEFIALLNNIRNNCCKEEELDLLEQYFQPDFIPDEDDGFITLTSHNYIADKINERELFKIEAELHQLKAEVSGDFPQNAFPADSSLELKEGAQIMFIKNDKGEDRRYYNGKMGTVKEIDRVNDKLLIQFPGDPDLLELSKEKWHNLRYQYDESKDEIREKEIGTFEQFPLRLAWAVTIHKSQGLTFEKAIIDAGRAFAAGQVYVALSRLTHIEGMVLRSRITTDSIQTNEQVLAFAQSELPEEELSLLIEEGQQDFIHQSILTAFQWEKPLQSMENYLKNNRKNTTQPKLIENAWINTLKEHLLQERSVGLKFIPLLEQLLQSKNYNRLSERTQAAVNWFTRDLDTKIIHEIKKQIEELKTKARTGKKIKQLQGLTQTFLDKKDQLKQAAIIAQDLAQSKDRHTLVKEATAMFTTTQEIVPKEKTSSTKPKSTKTRKGSSMRETLSLYQSGKSIEEIAKERALKSSTILGHLITFIPSGEIKAEELFEKDALNKLLPIVREHPEAKSSEIHELTKGKYSYPEIKAALLLLKKESKDKEPAS